jgi:hypothetical protein
VEGIWQTWQSRRIKEIMSVLPRPKPEPVPEPEPRVKPMANARELGAIKFSRRSIPRPSAPARPAGRSHNPSPSANPNMFPMSGIFTAWRKCGKFGKQRKERIMRYYKATSTQTGPSVDVTELCAGQIPETGQWYAEIHYGSTMSAFDSEAEALDAGRQSLEYDGWVSSREEAERLATEIWQRRQSSPAKRLRRLLGKSKNTLHIQLGLPRGEKSRAQVWRWAYGEDAIPAEIDAKVKEMAV